MNKAQPEPSLRSALFNRADVEISSPCVALSRSGPRKRAVRWKEPSLFSTTPGAISPAQGSQSASKAGRWRYSARFSMRYLPLPLHVQQRPVLDMAREDLHEPRIDTRAPDRQRMAGDPEHQARNPQLQAQAHGRGQGAIGNRHRARRAAQQDRLGQRAVQWHFEPRSEPLHAIVGRAHTTAPPEKLKNDRKNEDAANAIDRPKTIWISLRKPPEVSPKASARPVAMMMMTAMIRATGPWIDSRMDCSGPSQGIEEPAACAVPASSSISAASIRPCRAGRAKPSSRAGRQRRASGFAEIRKAGTIICVMAVLQVGQGTGKKGRTATAAPGMEPPAHPPVGSPRHRSRRRGRCSRCGACVRARRCG
mmetsp:Transcript_42340/g.99569  ORF Transcript_42340/g.99569 Transcript_42340/m.99569 type:complete len:365 (-) Transcript_42340:494-1588(-)